MIYNDFFSTVFVVVDIYKFLAVDQRKYVNFAAFVRSDMESVKAFRQNFISNFMAGKNSEAAF